MSLLFLHSYLELCLSPARSSCMPALRRCAVAVATSRASHVAAARRSFSKRATRHAVAASSSATTPRRHMLDAWEEVCEHFMLVVPSARAAPAACSMRAEATVLGIVPHGELWVGRHGL